MSAYDFSPHLQMFKMIHTQRAEVCGYSSKHRCCHLSISIASVHYHWSLTPLFPPGTAEAPLLFIKAENENSLFSQLGCKQPPHWY